MADHPTNTQGVLNFLNAVADWVEDQAAKGDPECMEFMRQAREKAAKVEGADAQMVKGAEVMA